MRRSSRVCSGRSFGPTAADWPRHATIIFAFDAIFLSIGEQVLRAQSVPHERALRA
jgi:hypothetical protein